MPNNVLHFHGRQSVFDSAAEYKDAIKRVKEIGGSAIALTDHGVLTGIFPFVQECLNNGIKPILGVEAYVQEDDEFSFKSHQILMAEDKIGFLKGISKAVTKANKRLDAYGAARMNREILTQCFGPSSEAHGHVCTTTACMQGVCNSIILSNEKTKQKMQKLEAKRDKHLYPGDFNYETKSKELESLINEISKLKEEKDQAAKDSKKPTKKLETAYKASIGTPDEESRKKVYEDTLASIESAKILKKELDEKIAKLSKKKTELNNEVKKMHESMDKWIELDDEIESLKETLMSDDEIKRRVEEELDFLVETFGEGHVFAEMQYHGIEDEAKCMPLLASIAHVKNIPLVAANDAHMVYGTPEERRKRQILRSLRFNKWEEESPGDAELFIKTDEQLYDMLIQILSEDDAKEAISNVDKIVDMCNYTPEKEEHYPVFKAVLEGENANDAIKRICNENINWRFPDRKGWNEKYDERLKYELDVICSMGYADYHLIVQDFLAFGRKLGHLSDANLAFLNDSVQTMTLAEMTEFVDNNQTEVGLTIGPGRGSAVGSLVCYLLGITSVDPLKYGLLFERD